MRRTALLLVLGMALPVLAGCIDDAPTPVFVPGPTEVAAADLTPGLYAFVHRGGPLSIAVAEGGTVLATLFDGDDQRIGRVDVSLGAIDMGSRDAGDVILHVERLEGTLEVRSGGTPVDRFHRVPMQVQRVPLVLRPVDGEPLGALLPVSGLFHQGEALAASVDVDLVREPLLLRLLAAGEAYGLTLTMHGPGGQPLRVDDLDYDTRTGSDGSAVMEELPARFDARRLAGTNYTVLVAAERMHGPIVLESWTYSRATDPSESRARPVDDPGRFFIYGQVPEDPVAIRVHPQATALVLTTNVFQIDVFGFAGGADCASGNVSACSDFNASGVGALATVFGPDDERIGVYAVPAGGAIQVPVHRGGEYVIVPKQGTLYVGADRVPSDFQMQVLETTETTVPSRPAGQVGEYAIIEDALTLTGTPFAVGPYVDGAEGLDPLVNLPGEGCSDPGSIRVSQGGEALGFHAPGHASDLVLADLLIDGPDIGILYDGQGGRCGWASLLFTSYLR